MDAGVRQKDGKQSVAVGNAGDERYRETLQRIADRGECPFCPDNLAKEHTEAIIRKGSYWILTKNQFTYPDAEERFLLISMVHAERLADLPPAAAAEAWELLQYLERECGIAYGAIAMRFGEPDKTGATVRHLHFHCIKPRDPQTTGYKPVRFRIGGR